MGMFDYLFVSASLLPLTDEEKLVIKDDTEWQTKNFDRELTEVYLTNEGDIKINRWELETVPKEERPFPNETGFREIFGSLRRANERLESVTYHGIVNFYTHVEGSWIEFNAKFTDGKLVSIEREN
jgi:hypothetical protein